MIYFLSKYISKIYRKVCLVNWGQRQVNFFHSSYNRLYIMDQCADNISHNEHDLQNSNKCVEEQVARDNFGKHDLQRS